MTQVVSHVSGHNFVSLVDDILQTDRMTISDVIEATQVC